MVVHEPGDWFDETLESVAAQDYTDLRTLFLLAARNDRRGRRADRTDSQRHPDGVRAGADRKRRIRPRRQRSAAPGRGRQRSVPAVPRRCRPGAQRRAHDGRRTVSFECRHRRAETHRLGRAAPAPARRARTRPVRRGRSGHRTWRVRPGTARRGPGRVRAPVGLSARAGRPVPGARRLRPHRVVPWRGHRPLLAGTFDRGTRDRGARRRRSPPRATPRTSSRSPSPNVAEPASDARRRHPDGWLASARSLAPDGAADGRRTAGRAVHGPLRGSAGIAAGAGRIDSTVGVDHRPPACDSGPTGRTRARGHRAPGSGQLASDVVPARQGNDNPRRRRQHRETLARGLVRTRPGVVHRRTGDRDRQPHPDPGVGTQGGRVLALPRQPRRSVERVPGELRRSLVRIDDLAADRVGAARGRQRAHPVSDEFAAHGIDSRSVSARGSGCMAAGDGVPGQPGTHRRDGDLRRHATRSRGC